MSSAFKSTIYENSRIHDNQVHAYSHVHGRWETKQRMTLIPKLRSDRKPFWPPFCSCLCFRCLVRCILVGSTDSFLVPGSREKYENKKIKQKFKYTFFNLCLTSTYFQYNGKHYKQLHGTAMGSLVTVSVVVAEIVMQNIEEQSLPTYTRTIPLWLCYVDDTFTAVHKH